MIINKVSPQAEVLQLHLTLVLVLMWPQNIQFGNFVSDFTQVQKLELLKKILKSLKFEECGKIGVITVSK